MQNHKHHVIQLSMKTFINNYYAGLCQHEIQMPIYPQYVLKSCQFQKQPSVYSNQNNPYLQSTKLAVTMFFFCILSAAEKLRPL